MSITWVAAGSFGSAGTAGGASPGLPSGWQTGDILILFCETRDGLGASSPAGWTALSSSPQFANTGTGTTNTALEVLWKVATASETAPVIGDTGNHCGAIIHAFRGVDTANPINVTAGSNETTADQTAVLPSVTTTVANTMVVLAASSATDTGTSRYSGWTNGNLTSLSERSDNSHTLGDGGGVAVATGLKATAGSTGTTSATAATGTAKGLITLALTPASTGGGGSGTITEDASSPAVVHTDGTTPISTASFIPPSGSLVVAMVSGGWGNSASTVSVKDSSSGTNWSGFSNPDTIVDSQAFYGIAGVFYKYFVTSPGSITVTASFTNLSNGEMLAVKVLTGVNPTNPIGATAAQDFGASTGTFSLNLTPTVSGSRVYGAVNFNDTADTAVSPNANTSTIQYYYSAGNGTAMWAFQGTSPTDGSTTTTYAGTLDAGQESGGAMQLVEIVPQVITGTTYNINLSDSVGLSDTSSVANLNTLDTGDTEGLTDSLSIDYTPGLSESTSDSLGLYDDLDLNLGPETHPVGGGALTEDASSPVSVHSTGTGPLTTAAFSPPANSLVVALVAGGWSLNSTNTATVSDSLGGANWSIIQTSSTGQYNGCSAIAYKYFVTSPGSISVSASFANLGGMCELSVKVLTGADVADFIGATATVDISTNTTDFTAPLTTTRAGSRVFGVVQNNNTGNALTLNSNTSAIDHFFDSSQFSDICSFQNASDTVTPSTVTFGATAPNTDGSGSITLVEILPTAGSSDVSYYVDYEENALLTDDLTIDLQESGTHVNLTDAEALSDSAGTVLSGIFTEPDSESLTDEISTSNNVPLAPSDAQGLIDSALYTQETSVSETDSEGLADSLASTQEFDYSAQSVESLTDTLTVQLMSSGEVRFSEAEALTDSLDVFHHQTGPLNFSDTEDLSDFLTTTQNYYLDLGESVGLVDDFSLSTPNGTFQSDIIGISDSLTLELIMPHSSPGFGEIAIDRFYVIERETAKEGNDGKLSISGQESSPPTTVNLVTFLHGQISGLEEGRLVPVVFRDKAERDGYYVVGNSSSSLTDYQDEVAAADWEIELDRMGSDTEVDIQSRLTGVVRVNDFSLTGQRWHAPAQVHYAYYTGSTIPSFVNRASSYGTMKVYLDVPDNSSPKWGCPVANYKGGRVKLLDELEVTVENEVEGVDRRLSTDTWSLDNGLVKIKPGSTGSLDIQTFSGLSWHSKQVDVQVDGTTVSSWSGANLLRNDLEQIVLRLVAQPDANSPGRTTLDLTLRRGSRFVEGYLQNSSSATLTVQSHTSEGTRTATTGSGYVTATSNDSNGNRFVAGSSRTFTDPTRGGVSASNTTKMDFFWGSVVGGGSAQTGDTAVDLRNQYIGCMSELTYAVRR